MSAERMSDDRQALAMPAFDDALDDFAPRAAQPPAPAQEAKRAVDAVSRFPSREAAPDGQLNLKGPKPILARFKAMCKADRRAYYDMLEILMDHFEQGGGQGGPGSGR
jgi:hypothetical protein